LKIKKTNNTFEMLINEPINYNTYETLINKPIDYNTYEKLRNKPIDFLGFNLSGQLLQRVLVHWINVHIHMLIPLINVQQPPPCHHSVFEI